MVIDFIFFYEILCIQKYGLTTFFVGNKPYQPCLQYRPWIQNKAINQSMLSLFVSLCSLYLSVYALSICQSMLYLLVSLYSLFLHSLPKIFKQKINIQYYFECLSSPHPFLCSQIIILFLIQWSLPIFKPLYTLIVWV